MTTHTVIDVKSDDPDQTRYEWDDGGGSLILSNDGDALLFEWGDQSVMLAEVLDAPYLIEAIRRAARDAGVEVANPQEIDERIRIIANEIGEHDINDATDIRTWVADAKTTMERRYKIGVSAGYIDGVKNRNDEIRGRLGMSDDEDINEWLDRAKEAMGREQRSPKGAVPVSELDAVLRVPGAANTIIQINKIAKKYRPGSEIEVGDVVRRKDGKLGLVTGIDADNDIKIKEFGIAMSFCWHRKNCTILLKGGE